MTDADRGMDVLEALILVRQERCRVTFGETEVVVEQRSELNYERDEWTDEWSEVARAPRFVAAVREAAIKRGWAMKK